MHVDGLNYVLNDPQNFRVCFRREASSLYCSAKLAPQYAERQTSEFLYKRLSQDQGGYWTSKGSI